MKGKLIHQFTHKWEIVLRYWIDEKAGRAAILGSQSDSGQILSYEKYRMGIRKIARNVDSRTLIATITPRRVFHSESFQSVMLASQAEGAPDEREQLFLVGILNSFLLNW